MPKMELDDMARVLGIFSQRLKQRPERDEKGKLIADTIPVGRLSAAMAAGFTRMELEEAVENHPGFAVELQSLEDSARELAGERIVGDALAGSVDRFSIEFMARLDPERWGLKQAPKPILQAPAPTTNNILVQILGADKAEIERLRRDMLPRLKAPEDAATVEANIIAERALLADPFAADEQRPVTSPTQRK